MNKTINVFSTQNNELRVINVNASNWGELQDALSAGRYTSEDGVKNYELNDCTCKVKETKLAFDNGSAGRSADLPSNMGDDVDFTLYIVPQKIKSGNQKYVTNEDLLEVLEQINAKFDKIFATLETEAVETMQIIDKKEALRLELMKEAVNF